MLEVSFKMKIFVRVTRFAEERKLNKLVVAILSCKAGWMAQWFKTMYFSAKAWVHDGKSWRGNYDWAGKMN